MIKTSIAMIVKNEETNLERCLDSFLPIIIEPWIELIVVDTGSTDRTVEVAERHFANVFKKEFVPWNFSEARNYAIEQCQGEWIFILDADEELPQNCMYQMKQIFFGPGLAEPTKFFHLRNIFSADNTGYSGMIQPRMFRNDPDFRYTGSIHNKPNAKGPFYFAPREIYINHYGYKFEKNEELANQKYDRSLPMLMEEIEATPHDTHILTHIIKTLRIKGEFDRVIEYGERWVEEMAKIDYHDGWFAYNEVWIDLADAYLRQENLEKALFTYERSLKYTNRLPDMELILGSYYSTKMGDVDNAYKHFQRAVEICTTPGSPYEALLTSNAEVSAPKLYNWLALYHWSRGDWAKAGEAVNIGIKLNNNMFNLRWDVWNANETLTGDTCPWCKQKLPDKE